MKRIFSCVDARANEYKQLLKDIICIESYTSDKNAVDCVGACLKAFAEKQGFYVHVEHFEKAGNGLLISWNENASLPPVVFTGHLDTVHPVGVFTPPLFREENGRYFGPGVTDMKGGLIVGLLVMHALKDAGWNARPIKFIMIGDEELSENLSGDAGKAFIRENARGSAAAITLEGCTDPGTVTVGRKGSIRYKVYVKGRAAHAGAHYAQGISAIKEAAQKILAIEAPSDPEQITYNCGILTAGTSPNTVPAEAMFTLYNRYWNMAQRQEIRDHVEGIIARSYIPGTVSTFDIVGERLPMDASEGNYALAKHINHVSQKYGFGEQKPLIKASGSDACYTAMAGVPSVCSMGVIGGNVHTKDEYMEADSLVSRAKLVAAIISELPEDFGIRSID